MEVQGVMETADCESRGCSSQRVDEYPDVVHAILLRRPECALLDERVYNDVDFSYLAECCSVQSKLAAKGMLKIRHCSNNSFTRGTTSCAHSTTSSGVGT